MYNREQKDKEIKCGDFVVRYSKYGGSDDEAASSVTSDSRSSPRQHSDSQLNNGGPTNRLTPHIEPQHQQQHLQQHQAPPSHRHRLSVSDHLSPMAASNTAPGILFTTPSDSHSAQVPTPTYEDLRSINARISEQREIQSCLVEDVEVLKVGSRYCAVNSNWNYSCL